MPAILAVSSVTAAPACNDGDDKPSTTVVTSGATDDPTESTTNTTPGTSTDGPTSTTTTATGPTTSTTDPTVATSVTTDAETDGVPDCDEIEDQPTCEATPLCVWPPEIVQCTVDCSQITDEAVCGVQQLCAWIDGECRLLII